MKKQSPRIHPSDIEEKPLAINLEATDGQVLLTFSEHCNNIKIPPNLAMDLAEKITELAKKLIN